MDANQFIFWCKWSISALCLKSLEVSSQCHVDLAGDGSLKNLYENSKIAIYFPSQFRTIFVQIFAF